MTKQYDKTNMDIAGPEETFQDVQIADSAPNGLNGLMGMASTVLISSMILGGVPIRRERSTPARDVYISDERHRLKPDPYLRYNRARQQELEARDQLAQQRRAKSAKKLTKRKAANAARARNKGR